MATHSSVLAWRIPGTAEPDGLPSMGLHRVGHDWSDLAAANLVLWWESVDLLDLNWLSSYWNCNGYSYLVSYFSFALYHAQLLSCMRLFCNPLDCSLPGSSVHCISQARILERVTVFFSRGSSRPRDGTPVSCIGRRVLYHWATRGCETWF